MEKFPLISVVVSIYNVEKYLERCIDSIIGQTYTNIEIILIDDGSTDSSGNIIDNYIQKDRRIKVIHKENGGLSDARNTGMNLATGEFICFLDSDDYIEKNLFVEILNEIMNKKIDTAIWGFYTDYVNKKEELIKRVERKIENENEEDFKIKNISENLLNLLGYAWNKLYNLKFLRDGNFKFEKGLSGIEDIEFNSRVLLEANIFLSKKIYNHYMQRDRETLGRKKYDNQDLLDERFIQCHIHLLQSWKIKNEKIEEIINYDRYIFFRRDLRNIIKDKKEHKINKKRKLKILTENTYKDIFNNYNGFDFKFKIIKILIKSNNIYLLNKLIK